MKFTIVLAVLALTSLTAARPAGHKHTSSSHSVHIASKSDFCLFIPSGLHSDKQPVDLGMYAKEATSICTTGNSTFPSGFIKSAHVLKTNGYVQVTGKLSVSGRYTGYQQFDNQVPKHGRCKGYKKFVGIIDAEAGQFCLRCCNNDSCPTDKASLGCQELIPGKY
ncbi:unnamed protein product [Umbelopsis vinacea]